MNPNLLEIIQETPLVQVWRLINQKEVSRKSNIIIRYLITIEF